MSNNAIVTSGQKMSLSAAFATPKFREAIHNALNDAAREKTFVSSIIAASAVNTVLKECTPASVLSAALTGESLRLPPSPQLGYYYFVPYEKKVKDPQTGRDVLDEDGNPRKVKEAQFQIGYKGLIQLALRSGYYKRIIVTEIRQGELKKWDPLTEEIKVVMIEDEELRARTPVEGYYAMLEYLNGFTKCMYWSYKKMLAHADRFSPAFSAEATGGRYPKMSYEDFRAGKVSEKDMWRYSSFWYKDFDGMAFKTMLRQIISKWGVMSIELQQAFEADREADVVYNEDGSVEINDVPQMVTEAESAGPTAEEAIEAEVVEEVKQVSMNDL